MCLATNIVVFFETEEVKIPVHVQNSLKMRLKTIRLTITI